MTIVTYASCAVAVRAAGGIPVKPFPPSTEIVAGEVRRSNREVEETGAVVPDGALLQGRR
jgi:hypothetical protein